MRVIHCLPNMDTEASGLNYSVPSLCEVLISQSVDVRLAFIGKLGQVPGKDYIQTFAPGIGPARLGNSPAMLRWLRQQVAKGAVDIMHNHSMWMMPLVYPGWSTKGTRVPLVMSPHGTMSEWAMQSGSKFKRVFWPLLQRPSIAHAACFHATAESEYEDIRRLGFKQPVAIIPNGIDLPEYRPKPDRARRTILFLGRVHPKKGIEFLIKAWAELESKFPLWDVAIAGPDNIGHMAEMQALAASLDLSRVYFLGPLYGADKFQAYRNADLFVLPTHSENFGLTVAEALACGTPAIVSQGAPWHGLEKNGAGWWPAIGRDPLLAALQDAMARPQSELDAMGEAGRLWMQRDFAWAHIGHTMQATYSWLLGRADQPSCVITD